ncbi:MAG: bacillithiol biosynthesis deacetylase BshB1 [Bryobacterales bacterium]|nr:bacillithiol biosynthesis deacetylase BshB1 [Bryobacterales bacterium]
MRNPYTDAPEVDPIDVLAIAAHPDDVEQTCGGTLIKLAELGYRTGVLDLTDGGMGSRGTPELRLEEAGRAGQIMLCKYRGNMHFPDARLENALAGRIAIASEIRRLRPRMVILPYWQARHPDHYRAAELGYEGCFLAGLRKLDAYTEPHRPRKIIYSAQYDSVEPSFIIDITSQFERRMAALLVYQSQYGDQQQASDLFPSQSEIRDRLETVAKFYGHKIGAKYGEAFVVKEALTFDDPMAVASVRSF